MAKRLPVPAELEHLIEKRESEADRRQRQQRSGSEKRQIDLGPLGAIESAGDLRDVPSEDRRRGSERRQKSDRRKKRRRKSGS
jgi:hypothetical protein